jgi:hypothetical protein
MSDSKDIKSSLKFKKLFWNDLLRSTGSGVLSTLIVNSSFLIFMEIVFSYPFDGNEKLNLGYKALRPRISIWLALNLIALFVLFVILIVPEPYLKKFNLCTMDLWNNTGYLIIMVRLVSLFVTVLKTKVFKTQTCYLLDLQHDDGTFLFPLISMILDVTLFVYNLYLFVFVYLSIEYFILLYIFIKYSQLLILPVAMFPYPWCLIFSVIELITQELKIFECRYILLYIIIVYGY